jgi:hypothetical protein
MTEAEITRLEALHAAATPGPWKACGAKDCPCGLVWSGDEMVNVATCTQAEDDDVRLNDDGVRANMHAIPAAMNALPSLLADSRALAEAVGLLREYRAGPLDLDDRIDTFLLARTETKP